MSDEKKNVSFPELGKEFQVDVGRNLLEIMRTEGIPIRADCGGIGRCNKCIVTINGKKRRSCRTNVMEDMEVIVPPDEAEGFAILLDYEAEDNTIDLEGLGPLEDLDLAIAVDIGTTTIVGKLLDLKTGSELSSFAQLNDQRPYGSDVISRIEKSLDDASELSALVKKQIDQNILGLIASGKVNASQVKRVVIAGNTTMTYILLGLPCRSLGFVPFTPAFTYEVNQTYSEIFGNDNLNCECTIVPFISAYVGGDLTAGLCSLGTADDFIIMDMGTNGEMIFKRGDRLICTATAAGPAFEGGDIECGSGSTTGAISVVDYENGEWEIQTIGASRPTGICGSGILDLMAVLVKNKMVDETGLVDKDVIEPPVILYKDPESDDEVFFTQKDVRQFQLAKSAVRTGLEIIMKEMGGEPPAQVFMAGGFGQNLNPQSAMITGMLPTIFEGRVHAIGNSSLSGAVKACLNEEARNGLVEMAAGGQEINLAAHPLFQDSFMTYMYFEV